MMKKPVTFLLLLAMILSLTACGSNPESTSQTESAETTLQTDAPAETEQPKTVTPAKLTNTMTKAEHACTKKQALTLLDDPQMPSTDPDAEHHEISFVFQEVDTAEWRAYLEENRDEISDEEYSSVIKKIEKAEETGLPYRYPCITLVDGFHVTRSIPDADEFDDGGAFTFNRTRMDENGELQTQKMSFDSFEDYLEYIRKDDKESGCSDEEAELEALHVQLAFDALKSGHYETLADDENIVYDESRYIYSLFQNYRSEWEYDRDAVEAIKDSIDEISFYDEEMNKFFTVHVTLPPDYDKDKTYPVFFLTDGIWRFGNCPELRKCMENGEAAPVILVSLWYSYSTPLDNEIGRYYDMSVDREPMLNFITDNLMPYLCENYNIDCADSTLYGHSDTGVFTHYALFNSDQYENQPFGHYIIGSPAFWGLYNYNDRENLSSDDLANDYGYFDRNETLNKTVFLCAGSQEDPDYADNYHGHDTTLEGTAKLKERLESHGADVTYKLYDSHHYQYIPEMLIEYLKETYPGK